MAAAEVAANPYLGNDNSLFFVIARTLMSKAIPLCHCEKISLSVIASGAKQSIFIPFPVIASEAKQSIFI